MPENCVYLDRMRLETPKAQIYIESLTPPESPSKRRSRQAAEDLGLDKISLSAAEGALLSFMIRRHNCRKFVEVGTLTGLSAQYILDGMDGEGTLWTLEKTPQHAEKAREALEGHPAGAKAHIVIGDARLTLETLVPQGPFDGIFIDGNKAAYGDYLQWAEKNVRRGGLIIADNIFLSGAVWGEETTQKFNAKQIRVMQEFNQRLADPRLYENTIVPTQEGLSLAVKLF